MSAGAIVEYGQPFYSIEEGDRYTPLMFGGTFEFPLYKSKKIFNVSLGFYPVYSIVYLNEGQAREFGLNIRFFMNLALSKHDVLRGGVGTGPHYMDHHTRRQAYGFLFCDVFLAAYRRYFPIGRRYCSFDLEAGYRHISNANTRCPNGGISNFLFGVGF